MAKNLGSLDRIVRALTVLAIVVVIVTGSVGWLVSIGLGVMALFLGGTSYASYCPIYAAFGASTWPAGRHGGPT